MRDATGGAVCTGRLLNSVAMGIFLVSDNCVPKPPIGASMGKCNRCDVEGCKTACSESSTGFSTTCMGI